MGSVRCQLSISLDGYVAGPNQSVADPIGKGGLRLHEWVFATEAWRRQHGAEGGEPGPDSEAVDDVTFNIGAYVMGRKMFGGGSGDWDLGWRGWWGEEPPYHAPVFVLTHHPREPLELHGTTFFFVTDGIDAALAVAREAAADQDVSIAGGASVVRQYLAARLLDELHLHLVPILLGAGEKLLVDVGQPNFEQLNVLASPTVAHVKYRVTYP